MKNKLLVIHSSINKNTSKSYLAAKLLENEIKNSIHFSETTEYNLNDMNLTHLTSEEIKVFYTQESLRDENSIQKISLSEKLTNDLIHNDYIILSLGMWNFNIPSVTKAWIDQICRVNKTFKYIEGKPKGLLQNKKIFISISSGGIYSSNQEIDFIEKYLSHVFQFIGIQDIFFLYSEGQSKLSIEEIRKNVNNQINELRKIF